MQPVAAKPIKLILRCSIECLHKSISPRKLLAEPLSAELIGAIKEIHCAGVGAIARLYNGRGKPLRFTRHKNRKKELKFPLSLTAFMLASTTFTIENHTTIPLPPDQYLGSCLSSAHILNHPPLPSRIFLTTVPAIFLR